MLRTSSRYTSFIALLTAPLYLSLNNTKSSTQCDSEGASHDLCNAVGNTPLIHLKSISAELGRDVYAKAEFMNPTSSVKDRAAKFMILEAEKSNKLKPGGCIVEATGGNTG